MTYAEKYIKTCHSEQNVQMREYVYNTGSLKTKRLQITVLSPGSETICTDSIERFYT